MVVSFRLRRFIIGAGVATAALLAPPGSAQDETPAAHAPQTFNVRAHPGVSGAALTFIAREGEPNVTPVNRGMDVQALLRSKCGDIRQVYLSETRRLNPGMIDNNSRLTSDGEIRLPACPRYWRNARIAVVDEISVEDLLMRETGLRGPITRLSFQRRNPAITGPTIPAGTTVTLEYASAITTIVLREGSTYTVDTANARIAELEQSGSGDESVVASDAVPGFMIADLHDGTLGGAPATCNESNTGGPWPIDAEALMEALDRAMAEGGTEIVPAGVAVLDSAFIVPPAEPFVWQRIVRHVGSTSAAPNHYGLNAVTRTDPPLATFDFRNGDHGTMVATLALGGRSVFAADANNHSRVRLRLYSIARLPRGAEPPEVQEGYVLTAIQDAVQNDTFIINASFSFKQRTDTLQDHLRHDSRLLVVAAAGNDPIDISSLPRWPASYGGIRGALSDRVVTVAASDRAGALASYSARSSTYVDLAAPGCSVPTLGPDLQDRTATGTSFAAPLVSYTAGLIRQFGITQASRIKERLLISTDVRRELYGHVWASGISNPVKAVDLFHDRLEVDGAAQPLRGRVDFSDTGELVCRTEAERLVEGTILKIARFGNPAETGRPEWLVIWRNRTGHLDRCIADLTSEFIIFEEGENEGRLYSLSNVREIIVRALEPREN